jgi:hypothetical protein
MVRFDRETSFIKKDGETGKFYFLEKTRGFIAVLIVNDPYAIDLVGQLDCHIGKSVEQVLSELPGVLVANDDLGPREYMRATRLFTALGEMFCNEMLADR